MQLSLSVAPEVLNFVPYTAKVKDLYQISQIAVKETKVCNSFTLKEKKTDSFLYLHTYALKLTNEGANLYFDHVCSRSRPYTSTFLDRF